MMRRLPFFLILLLSCTLIFSCRNKEAIKDNVAELLATRPTVDYSIKDSTKIQTLPSGLQIYMVQEGPGSLPTEGTRLRLHYEGRLLDGTVFDDTWKRKAPFEVLVEKTALIAGMEEGLRHLRVGSKAVLIIPPALGYPKGENPPNIPPNSTLIYKVDILGNI